MTRGKSLVDCLFDPDLHTYLFVKNENTAFRIVRFPRGDATHMHLVELQHYGLRDTKSGLKHGEVDYNDLSNPWYESLDRLSMCKRLAYTDAQVLFKEPMV
jgi:hypothetical protein